jgi:hypothetical protein
VVVYDENGFHPDQFMTGEFYGEFGSYDVHLEVPDNYVVAATGVVNSGDPGWKHGKDKDKDKDKENTGEPNYKTVHFHADNVHDFAWNADPTYVVQDTTWSGINIYSVYRKHSASWKDSTLAHAIRATQWLSDKVGLYPYPQVTVTEGLLGGGMEYPMLVMDGRASESLVVHEIGHIYFFGIFGNDEREDAWLDEGFTSFQTNWYMNERYGEHGPKHLLNWYQRVTPQFTRLENIRRQLFPILRRDFGERISTRAEEFQNSYRAMVYWKSSLMFHALRYVVGDEAFDTILKTYFERWKFKHVNEERFKSVCEEISGMDLDSFFEEWLHTRKNCDYELKEVKTRASDTGGAYTTQVTIKRLGEMTMPLELVFSFEDGTVQRVRLEGRLRTIIKTFDFPEKPKSVALNPDNEIMDINLSNNFSPRRRDLQLDWPNNYYHPEDAYEIRYRPEIWYNDIDGAKVGLHLRGSYANWSRRLSGGIYYGAESKRLDFTIGYKKPLRVFGHNAELRLSGYKMEGRQDGTFEIDYRRRHTLIRPPTHRLVAGVNYHDLSNARYLENPERYESESDVSFYARYTIDPQADFAASKLTLGIRNGREWFGGSHKYTSFEMEAKIRSRTSLVLGFDAGLRTYLGIVTGSVPFQQKFALAGGGVLEEEKRFFLRSPGAIWDEAHYHVPGQGNLRGYHEGSFAVNRLLALNVELGKDLPWISGSPAKRLGSIRAVAFADVGRTFDRENPIRSSPRVQALADAGLLDQLLFDAGVGFQLHRSLPFYDLRVRFDIPFYVNHPELNGSDEKETEYRYVLSLTSLF